MYKSSVFMGINRSDCRDVKRKSSWSCKGAKTDSASCRRSSALGITVSDRPVELPSIIQLHNQSQNRPLSTRQLAYIFIGPMLLIRKHAR